MQALGRYYVCHIELSPLRADMVEPPTEYPWFSYYANTLEEVA